MEIILKENVKNLGRKNEVLNVKPGFARNYLIPKGFAILATGSAKKVLAENLKQKGEKDARKLSEKLSTAENLKAFELKIGAKVSPTGKIFGSINSLQISDALKKQFDFDIDRKYITLDAENIKEVGVYKANIALSKEVKVDITFEVVAD